MDSFYVFFVNKGYSLIFPLNPVNTTAARINDLINKECNLRTSDQILLDSKGCSPDLSKSLAEYEGLGSQDNPLFLFQKSGNDRDDIANDVNYIASMIADAEEQVQYVLKYEDPLKIYMELPERASNCENVATSTLKTCATLVQEHRLLYQGWMALINNLDVSVGKMQRRSVKFQKLLTRINELVEKSSELLNNYDEILDQLKKIEVPPEVYLKPSPLMMMSQTTNPESETKMSLYDVIARADPESSLEELPDKLNEQIRKLSEHNTKNIFNAINTVADQSKSAEYRDIKGISKRFSQLEHSLQSLENHQLKIVDNVKKIVDTPKNIDQSRLKNVLKEHIRLVSEVLELFEKLKSTVKVFHQSKQELLQNVRTRLSGFIIQSYDKLSYAHVEIQNYETKSNFIRLQMDLIEQINDSPILYSQTVSEVVRRNFFKSELEGWHTSHSQRCLTLYSEENDIRERLARKLKKHFLHALFPGFFDDIPNFFVKSPLSKFDDDLPNIGTEYITMLRKSLPELEQFLKVTLPSVSSKINIKDEQRHTPLSETKVGSFITEEPMKMAKSQFNYSPGYWNEDGCDSSPVPEAILMNKPECQMRESQIGAIPIVPSLQQLDGLNNSAPDSHVATSAPIAIPYKSAACSAPRAIAHYSSEDSCKFSPCDQTTMENVNSETQQFALDDVNSTPNAHGEFLESLKIEVATISKGLRDVRADITNSSFKFQEDFQEVDKFLLETLPKTIEKMNAKQEDIESLLKYSEILRKLLIDANKKMRNSDDINEQLKSKMMEERDEDKDKIAGLEDKVIHLQEELKNIETETFKKLTIEYELMNDRTRSDYEEQILSKEQEIEELKREIEKKNVDIQKLIDQSDPYTEDYKKTMTMEIKSELEREYKSRIELITKAVEQKKDENIARIKKQCEIELKVLSHENESKAKKLLFCATERDNLRKIIVAKVKDGPQILNDLDNSLSEIARSIPRESLPNVSFGKAQLTQNQSSPEMEESVFVLNSNMATSTAVICSSPSDLEVEVQQKLPTQTIESKTTIGTQTKIALPAMNMMVTIQDVKAGSTVLVIWDERHKAYVLFCCSQYRHFVKESSVKKLGLNHSSDSVTPRRNWILGKAANVDNCSIKKAVNRYNLPVGTIVKRVDVDPVSLDMDSDEPTMQSSN